MYPLAECLEEPALLFRDKKEDKDPRTGLEHLGPFHYDDVSSPLSEIRIGLICDKSTFGKAKHILNNIQKPVLSKKENQWLFPSFPGISKGTNFACELKLSEHWNETITEREIEHIMGIPNANLRINEAAELYKKKIQAILMGDDRPHVIICCLPEKIEKYCGISEKTRGAKTAKPTEEEKQIEEFKKNNQKFLSDFAADVVPKEPKKKAYDLRRSIKGKVMEINNPVPTQLFRESTMDAVINWSPDKPSERQDPASFSWNFSTALYYKANGKPWRLAKLRLDTCYIGVSFFKDKRSVSNDIQTSMAQVFTDTGEGLVLRGTEVYKDNVTKEAHLSQKQAKELVQGALQLYKLKAKRDPVRVVIHKETQYSDAEKKGFSEAIGDIQKDFITINKRKGIRFLRHGQYPVLRGTTIQLTPENLLLYTSGYTPRLRTYPGMSVPQPLFVTHHGDSPVEAICKEILGLTKLNWNTTFFSESLPITLEFSSRVGEILSEISPEATPQHHYSFYM